MVTAQCPHCNWMKEVRNEYLNEIVECPECTNDFKVSDSNSTNQLTEELSKKNTVNPAERAKANMKAKKNAKASKSKKSLISLKTIFTVFLLLIGIGYFSNNQLKSGKYLKQAIAELSSEKLPAGMPAWVKGLMQNQVRFLHSKALFEANKSVRASKKSTKVADYATYKSFLQKEINSEQARIFGSNELELTLKNISGYWMIYSTLNEAYMFCKITENGSANFALTEDKNLDGYTELNVDSNHEVSISSNSIQWSPTNSTPNIRLTTNHWLIEEESGTITHYRRVPNKTIDQLKKLGM